MMATSPVRNMTIRKLLKMENQWICRAYMQSIHAQHTGMSNMQSIQVWRVIHGGHTLWVIVGVNI
jgi:hypothetical protein